MFSYFFTLFVHPVLKAKCADYVVVGVGTAGAVFARILSDDKRTSVIALHNGPNLTQDPEIKFSENATITVPSTLLGSSLAQAGEATPPQTNADNRQLP